LIACKNHYRIVVDPVLLQCLHHGANAVIDRVRSAFDGVQAELIQTNLSEQDEEALRAAFADEA